MKQKLKLNDLKVSSFTTTLTKDELVAQKGASGFGCTITCPQITVYTFCNNCFTNAGLNMVCVGRVASLDPDACP